MNIISTESSASSAGYIYQNIVALEKIVELLENDNIKQVTLDKKNTPHIEDVVIDYANSTEYIQIKHSNSEELSTFTKSDMFAKEKSLFSKTFYGWETQNHKDNIKIIILTNDKISITKSSGSSLNDIVKEIKTFQKTGKIDNSILQIMLDDLKNNKKKSTKKVQLKKFLKDLYFEFEYPSKYELLEKIKIKLQRIIQTDNIDSYFDKLYTEVSIRATDRLEKNRTFTKQLVEKILDIQNKPHYTHFYDIPKNYIDIEQNSLNLQKAYQELKQGYIFLKGKAGSGKTTFITKFLSEEYKQSNIAVLRYYLFHFDDKLHEDSSDRVKKNFFYYDLSLQLKKYLGNDFIGEKYLNKDTNNYNTFWKNLKLLTSKYQKVIVIVDGIDHAVRADKEIETFFDGLKTPNRIEENIVFILSGQPNWDNYPSWLKEENNSCFKTFNIEPFSIELCKRYIQHSNYWQDNNLVDYISEKSFRLTKGFPLNLRVFIEGIKDFSSKEEIENYLKIDNRFDDLHFYYNKLFDDIKNKYFYNKGSDFLKFQALLYLLKEPISSEVVDAILAIDIFEFEEIISKLAPILQEVEEEKYELFHNDIRIYLKDKISPKIKKHTIQMITNYYLDNLNYEYSQQYLFMYLEYLQDHKKIKEFLTFERLDLKYKLLRDREEIESEIKIGLQVARERKDPLFILQILLIEQQHDVVIDNLLGSAYDNFNVNNTKEESSSLYSYITPSKSDLSPKAMREREEFYERFIDSDISSIETKKYFFNKFSFDILEYIEQLKQKDMYPFNQNEFIEKYFNVYLQTDKKSAILELKEIQELENKNREIKYITENFFEVYLKKFGSNLDIIDFSKNYDIKYSNKIIIDLALKLHEDNKKFELKILLSKISKDISPNNRILYLIIVNKFNELLPTDYIIEDDFKTDFHYTTENGIIFFEWAYIKTYQKRLTEPFSLFKILKKDHQDFYGTSKISLWLGFLSAKQNLQDSDIKKLFIFISNKESFTFYGVAFFIDKFLALINRDKQLFVLNQFIKIYDELSEEDELLFYFYKWCQQYHIHDDMYTFKKLENELKFQIHGLKSSDRIGRVETLIKIRKELNEDYSEYLYSIRKYALSYGFKKDYQSEMFMEYFKNILQKDYQKYIDTIYDYLYLEQFKQNEYTEKTTTLEEVLKEILEVVYLNSKADLFNILEYVFQDKKHDSKKIGIPSKLFLELLPHKIKDKEEALISYSFFKMGTTFAYYNDFTVDDEEKIEMLLEESKRFNISFVNIFKNRVYRDEYKEKIYPKISKKEFIQLLEEQKNTKSYSFNKSPTITANIKYYPNTFFEKRCEYQSLHLGGLLNVIPLMENVNIDDANKLVLNYLKNLYSNVSEDIEPIKRLYENFDINILLEFLKKYFYCINAGSVSSAIQTYIKIGEHYIDETIDFIIKSIDYNNPFHTKIFLDILVELPLVKYTNLEKLTNSLVNLFEKSQYIYLDYSFRKIFKILNIKTQKEYTYSFLEIPQSILIEAEKKSDSFQRFFSTTDYQTTKTFIDKLEYITSLETSFLWEKINYFKLKKNISINYYGNCSKGLKLLNFHTPFFEAEFLQWLYQEDYISWEQNSYLIQILQTYDLEVLKQEHSKPIYINTLPSIKYNQDIHDYLSTISMEKILSNAISIFSGYWQETISDNYLATVTFNTVIMDKRLKYEFQDLERFYSNFGIDSFYKNKNNLYYQTVDSFQKTLLPIDTSTYCLSSSFLQNSQLYYLPPNNYKTQLIRWNYGDINTDESNSNYGQINELIEPIRVLANEKMIQFCRIEIQHTKENKSDNRLFILEEGEIKC